MKFCLTRRQKHSDLMISSKQMKKDIYLSEFINSEIARLDEISVGKMSGIFAMRRRVSSNMEKFKLFVDEIDQIKKLSYSTIKKEDLVLV